MASLDCVVIGYNEGDFDDYRIMCERAGPHSPEYQIFSKEHLLAGGVKRPWLDAFSLIRQQALASPSRFHVAEVFNLAALYLTSFLRRRGISAEPVSLFSAEQSRLRDLLAQRPAIVAITTTFYVNIMPLLPIVEFVRGISPGSHIVVGGPLIDNLCTAGVSAAAQDMLTVIGADSYIVDSQGESALVSLCEAIRSGDSASSVDNVIYPLDGTWTLTRRRPENNDLDLAAIDWAGFDPAMIGKTAQVRTARSCAFKCSFCDYPSRAGALATASIDTVRQELRALAGLGVRNIVFVDDTFNVPPKRFKQLCQMLIEEDLGLRWYSYFRCSNARDEESFDLAARSGCAGVFLGIESGDSTVLANMHKLAQDSQYRTGIGRLKERGITTFASIIVGFPGETAGTVQNTVDFLNETAPDFWRGQAWWANPRSPVFREREAFGLQGQGYSWSHLTMSSAEAADLTDEMFDSVTESIWLPLYDFDFWALPYLAGKGVGIPEIKDMLRGTEKLMRLRGAPGGAGQAAGLTIAELEQAFARQVAGLDMAESRFTF